MLCLQIQIIQNIYSAQQQWRLLFPQIIMGFHNFIIFLIKNMQKQSLQIDKKALKSTDLYTICKVTQNQKELLGKVFFDNVLSQHNLIDAIEYNSEVLQDQFNQLAFNQHMLPIRSYPHQQGILFVIPCYKYRLDQYIEQKGALQELEVMNISQQLFKAIYGIVMSGYFHRSIRAEHFVFHNGVWKLQSLVFDEIINQKGLKSQYLWSNQHQPPEAYLKQTFSEQELDQKVVWDFGCLVIHMILGHHKLKTQDTLNLFKNSQFSFQKIKAKVGEKLSENLRSILGKMCHYQKDKRMSLKELISTGFFSGQVTEHFKKNCCPDPQSKIYIPGSSSASKVRVSQMQRTDTKSAEKNMTESIQKKKQLMTSRQKKLLSGTQFLQNLQQIIEDAEHQDGSSVLSKRNYISQKASFQNLDKNNSIKTVINQFKNFIDKGQILTISQAKLKKALQLQKDQAKSQQMLILTKYALHFVKAMDLSLLAKTMNQNSKFYFFNTDSPQWDIFHGSQEYHALKKLVNYRKIEALLRLQKIKLDIIKNEQKLLKGTSKQIQKFVKGNNQHNSSFVDIKYAYRQIIKKSYDLVAQHYNKNKIHEWATIGMYFTFCLTIDKLYIPQDFKDNFKFYFKWKGNKLQYQYVPLEDFQEYIETAESNTLLQNSIYIISKYFEI